MIDQRRAEPGARPAPGGAGGAGWEAAQRPTLGKRYADGRAAAGEDLDEQQRREEQVRNSWRWRELLWQVSIRDRVRKCARVPHGAGGAILRLSEGKFRIRGSGPLRLSVVLRWWLSSPHRRTLGPPPFRPADRGRHASHGATLATFTVRHHAGQRLDWLLDQLAAALPCAIHPRRAIVAGDGTRVRRATVRGVAVLPGQTRPGSDCAPRRHGLSSDRSR